MRIQTPEALLEEDELDVSLRPQLLSDFVGQASLKDQLCVAIEAALLLEIDLRRARCKRTAMLSVRLAKPYVVALKASRLDSRPIG